MKWLVGLGIVVGGILTGGGASIAAPDLQVQADRKAFALHKEQAQEGDLDAQFKLAADYDFGRGVKEDDNAAARWYCRAALRGQFRAQYNLGLAYFKGGNTAIEQDAAEGLRWLTLAARQGHAAAMYYVGDAFRKGQGTEADPAESYRWYALASKYWEGDAEKSGWTGLRDRMGAKVPAERKAALDKEIDVWAAAKEGKPDWAITCSIGEDPPASGKPEPSMEPARTLVEEILRRVGQRKRSAEAKAGFGKAAKRLKVEIAGGEAAEIEAEAEILARKEAAAIIGAVREQLRLDHTETRDDALYDLEILAERGRPRGAKAQPKPEEGEGEEEVEAEAEDSQETAEKEAPKDNRKTKVRKRADKLIPQFVRTLGQVVMGDLYRDGRYVDRNFSQARVWYLMAAREGVPEAAAQIALQYEAGQGVPSDLTRSFEWYEVAALAGHRSSILRLAAMLVRGKGGSRNPVLASLWLERATELGQSIPPDLAMLVHGKRSEGGEAAGRRTLGAETEAMGEAMGKAAEAMGEGLGKGMEKMVEGLAKGLQGAMEQMADVMVQQLMASMVGDVTAEYTPVRATLGVAQLVDRYVLALNSSDRRGFEGLFHPGSRACITDANRKTYDEMLEKGLKEMGPAKGRSSVKLASISADGTLPYERILDYPVRPTHHLEADIGAGRVLNTGLVKEGETWYLLFPCVKEAAFSTVSQGELEATDTRPPPKAGGWNWVPSSFGPKPPEGARTFAAEFMNRAMKKDREGLKAMVHPTVRACAKAKSTLMESDLDFMVSNVDFDKDIVEISLSQVTEQTIKPAGYPILPVQELNIYYDMAVMADGSRGGSPVINIFLTDEGGEWQALFPCPELAKKEEAERAAKPRALYPEAPKAVELPADGQAFLSDLQSLMRAKDRKGLDGLLHPKVAACNTATTRAFFDFDTEVLTGFDVDRIAETKVTRPTAKDLKKYTYPVPPTHEVGFKITDPDHDPKAGGFSSTTITVPIAKVEGKWYRVPFCPTGKEMAMLPFARAMLQGFLKGAGGN